MGSEVKKPKTKSVPFGPAMNVALAAMTQQFQAQLQQFLSAEAASLKLPDGSEANLQKREWVVPA